MPELIHDNFPTRIVLIPVLHLNFFYYERKIKDLNPIVDYEFIAVSLFTFV